MQFNLKKVAGYGDVPIASIRYSPLQSHDMIQVLDYSGHLAGNAVATVSYLETHPQSGGSHELALANAFGEIQLSDERFLDRTYGIAEPLWYRHTLRQAHYNTSAVTKTKKIRLRGGRHELDRTTVLANISSGQIIVLDSCSGTYRRIPGGDVSTLSSSQLFIDYGAGTATVRISGDSSYNAAYTYEIALTFQILALSLSVTQDDISYYRPEATAIVASNAKYFELSLLSTSNHPMRVRYQAISRESREIEEVEELTVAQLLYAKVSVSARQYLAAETSSTSSSRVYSVEERDGLRYMSVITVNPDRVFYFRRASGSASLISVEEPRARSFYEDWFPTLTNSWLVCPDGRRFDFGDEQYRLCHVVEKALIVDNTTLSITRDGLVAFLKPDNTWWGISVTDQNGKSRAVSSFDSSQKLVFLSDEVSLRDTVTVSYLRMVSRLDLPFCLNPMQSHSFHNFEVSENVVLIAVADSTHATGTDAVCALVLPKYVGGRLHVYEYSEIDELLNSDDAAARQAVRALMTGLPTSLLASSERIEPFALLQVSNPLDEDGFAIEDARIYGGGTVSTTRGFFDYTSYDGELVDLENKLCIEVDESVVLDLAARALTWDRDVIIADDPAAAARQAAESLIRNKARKFSMLGTTQEVRIG
jgi:hypothetical protein